MERPKIIDFIKETIDNPSIELMYLKDYVKELEVYADKQDEAISVIHCCKPKGTVKTIDFERTIDLLDAEIDSLKDAYHQETIADRKTQYSSMILESLHAKKKLKQ